MPLPPTGQRGLARGAVEGAVKAASPLHGTDHRARKQLKADHRRGWIAGQAEHNTSPTLSGNDGFAGFILTL